MNIKSEFFRVDFIIGARRLSNYFWATVVFLGSLGFFIVGVSSYLQKNIVFFLSASDILFTPQGIVMCFYGIAGLFLSFYLWFTIFLDIGSGYNEFDKKKGIISIFRWGYPGQNRRIKLSFPIKDVQAIKLEVKEVLPARRMIYIKIKGQQDIPLNRIAENITLREMEDKAADLARFLKVSIEGL
uniref:Photosystem I assembly protein Ycf4 n=1 Tax=Chaetosphaeridium globosum TaxID=96477 RepID=YCF4_CHAGL|nr:photosystem I assembly protein Ycf4 [Chaetosphaeridium globosum]Q8M9X4.1 RecName: Full=Photosystem I assembly protein Ycf4 [Chaetosphaeridium globosum]AAM96584.1 hypothetical chloroplast RF4 [Chaetosphaeridium globosum]